MFESIKLLRPYFHSLREVKDSVSLDVKLPLNWEYNDTIKLYSSISFKVQDKNESFNLVSLISQSTQNGYDVVFACANEIIIKNKEEEEKQHLFQEKLKELQQLFKKESLEKLKDINLLNNYGQENSTSTSMAREGNAEGYNRSESAQDEND